MYCTNCGTELPRNSEFCSECGYSTSISKTQQVVVEQEGSESVLWGLLGFFCPIAGLVLYLVWKQTKPKSAKAAGIGALIYTGLCLVILILYIILIAVALGTSM